MSVYNLDDWRYLLIDVDAVLKRLDDKLKIQNSDNGIIVLSNIRLEDKVYWASKESNQAFNFNIPDIKSIHNDMYRLIESLFKAMNPAITKNFRITLEAKYSIFNFFRILNNKFKHFLNDGEFDEIALIQVVEMTNNKINQRVSVMCQFKKGTQLTLHNYTEFVKFFYTFLLDNKLIHISPSQKQLAQL